MWGVVGVVGQSRDISTFDTAFGGIIQRLGMGNDDARLIRQCWSLAYPALQSMRVHLIYMHTN